MRGYRVFNDVTKVRVVWKLAGFRLGGFAQIAMLSHMALCAVLVQLAGLIPAAVIFIVGFVSIALYVTALSRIDPSGVISELTALRLLRRGLRRPQTANFDLPDL